MLTWIDQGKVGIVIYRDPSRLARNPADDVRFFLSAKRAGALIHENEVLRDPANDPVAELFGMHLGGLLAWYENENRARHFLDARIAKARRGEAVSAPPIGYVRSSRGQWTKDSDPQIQAAIERVFALYATLGSLGNVIKHMRANHLDFPRRLRGVVTWRGVDPAHLHNILRNPAYVGDYVFRRHPARSKSASPALTARREPIVTPDHHEPYVTRAQWQTIQDMLTSRRPSIRPVMGKGHALLQGLLRCGQCERWMRTQYWARDGQARTATYTCRHIDEWGESTHVVTCLARFVDRAVVQDILKALRPFQIETALAVIDKARAEQTSLERTQRRQLERAEDEVERAHQAYLGANKKHPRVKVHLEAQFDAALERLEQLRAALSGAAPRSARQPLGPEETTELLQLSSQFLELWDAPTTTNTDRKQLLRILLSEVVVHQADKAVVDLEMVWVGGRRERIRALRPQGVDARVREQTLAGVRATTIATELRAAGVITSTGRPMTLNAVSQKLGRLGLRKGAQWQAALGLIRQALLDGRQHREILTLLKDQAAPVLGSWDSRRLSDVIRRLRQGIPDIDPLPEVLPGDRQEQEVVQLLDARRRAGATWTEIADGLNAAGLKPQRAERFTPNQLRTLHLRAQARVAPAEPSTTRP
jgi:DNA invertase Pin-like site-specific DNA recombinase